MLGQQTLQAAGRERFAHPPTMSDLEGISTWISSKIGAGGGEKKGAWKGLSFVQ